MDKSTGCLSLYPLPKIDEMFSKLGGAKVFSTTDLHSGYYHIGITRESRAKSAFVVPMGKWEFKCTPFRLSQALAYFQLLIDKVLMGCSNFAMGYLDDIIIFSKSEEEHLQLLEELFTWLRKFGLKMKREKCSFFKKHIQYLGHLVLEKGFEPLPEKLESIKNMPAPRTAKEVKQFLGLIGYYRKFVPCFADISRPLTKLTRHNFNFDWTEQCQKAFNHLRELLMEYPILRYPDPKQGYILYTDTSGIGWSGVLMQEYKDKKGKIKNHPICYVSGQFRGSQLNWAALTKEAYAIYMSIRRLGFYVTDAEVTIKCDHLPLRKFLNKQTMNSKVNNWAVELEQFKLHLDWIPDSKNLLADSLSHLLNIDPDTSQIDEPQGHEFGSYCFEDLQPAQILEIVNTEVIELKEAHSEHGKNLLNSRKLLEMRNIEFTETPRPQHQQQSQGRTIYMSIRRLSFYITDAEVTIKCDHLPLRKFLNKQTMNSKVNNWVVELEQFKLHLDWIPGSKNLLTDSLSHLLDIDPDTSQIDEPQGHEFGSYCFEDLQPAQNIRNR